MVCAVPVHSFHSGEPAQAAAPATEWARRLRELREDAGYKISSHHDRLDLSPGEYVLESPEPLPNGAGRELIPPGMRREVLEGEGCTCQQCGAGAGETSPWKPGRRVRLQVDYEVPPEQGGPTTASNLRTRCSYYNQHKGNVRDACESAVNLLARIRSAPRKVQHEVHEALREKFQG